MNCAAVEITRSSAQQAASIPTAGSLTTLMIVTIPTAIIPSTTNVQAQPPTYDSQARDTNEQMAFHDRPLMFVADDGNDCLTPHTTAELRYPEPGPDIVIGDGAYPLELPTGQCGQEQMLAKQAFTGDRAAVH